MNIDQVITNAFMEYIPGEGLFVVEGNPATNAIHILPADKAMMDNLACLAWGIDRRYQYLGTCTDEQLAKRQIDIIRSAVRDEAGNNLLHTSLALAEAGIALLMHKTLWLVEVHPAENKIRISPEPETLMASMEAFATGEHTGYQFVSLHTEETRAKEMEQRIRRSVRDEAGTRLAFDVRLRKE